MLDEKLPFIFSCSTAFGGAENDGNGGLSPGVDTLNSLCGLKTGSTIQRKVQRQKKSWDRINTLPAFRIRMQWIGVKVHAK